MMIKTKKEIKEEYKSRKTRAGIYQIKNQSENRIFLNFTFDADRAFNLDQFSLRINSHLNKKLQTDWNQLGADAFTFEFIDELEISETASQSDIRVELKELLLMHQNRLKESGTILY
ncbi:MAG: GIY-YIG nuclease family protein [Calditrichaeota bacterium]|nr:GIY-YIG nuclease family protein [Calditrichota bacterium]